MLIIGSHSRNWAHIEDLHDSGVDLPPSPYRGAVPCAGPSQQKINRNKEKSGEIRRQDKSVSSYCAINDVWWRVLVGC
jgi:hypothetical protein